MITQNIFLAVNLYRKWTMTENSRQRSAEVWKTPFKFVISKSTTLKYSLTFEKIKV